MKYRIVDEESERFNQVGKYIQTIPAPNSSPVLNFYTLQFDDGKKEDFLAYQIDMYADDEEYIMSLLKLSLDYNASMIAVASMVINSEKQVNQKKTTKEFNRIRDDYIKKTETILKQYEKQHGETGKENHETSK